MHPCRRIKRITVCYKVDWDLEDDDDSYSPEELGLPDFVGFTKPVLSDVSEALSNKFGWTVNSIKAVRNDICREFLKSGRSRII